MYLPLIHFFVYGLLDHQAKGCFKKIALPNPFIDIPHKTSRKR
jgi:hypothetical protein